jgi:hypothetical protein
MSDAWIWILLIYAAAAPHSFGRWLGTIYAAAVEAAARSNGGKADG